MKNYIWYMILAALCIMFVQWQGSNITPANAAPLPPLVESNSQEEPNLLVNGNMEELPFYWEPPNHWVAGGWERWWIGDVIPEYDDVRAWRPYRHDGDHAQIYFWIWPQGYTAGIFQQVAVQPCTFYQFDMYGRNSSYNADYHARIGIDPLGRKYSIHMEPFPADVVWSPEQTFHNTWGQHIVVTEAYSDHVTAITYVSPDPGFPPYDTFWDTGRLFQVQPPDGRLPAPDQLDSDGFITNVITSTSLDYLVVEWDTLAPASSQVWYSIMDTTTVTSTSPYTESVIYLPLVLNNYGAIPTFQYFTPADQTQVTHHKARLGPFSAGDQKLQFIVLSRRMDGGDCRTSASELVETTFHVGTVYHLYLPLIVR